MRISRALQAFLQILRDSQLMYRLRTRKKKQVVAVADKAFINIFSILVILTDIDNILAESAKMLPVEDYQELLMSLIAQSKKQGAF